MALLASPKYAFKEALMHAAPDEPGVYALYFGRDLLYLGAATAAGRDNPDTIRGRLLAHFHGELRPAVATHYRWEIVQYPNVRLAEILRALGAETPPYNRAERA